MRIFISVLLLLGAVFYVYYLPFRFEFEKSPTTQNTSNEKHFVQENWILWLSINPWLWSTSFPTTQPEMIFSLPGVIFSQIRVIFWLTDSEVHTFTVINLYNPIYICHGNVSIFIKKGCNLQSALFSLTAAPEAYNLSYASAAAEWLLSTSHDPSLEENDKKRLKQLILMW